MIIPILHLEKQLQVNDLTRFDASRSIVTKGTVNPINSIKIKPGSTATEIEVFNAQNNKNWFLDYVFNDETYDIDITNNQIDFTVGDNSYTTNVPANNYTLANLLTAIKTAIEAVASPLTLTITVDEKKRVHIVPSLGLKFLPKQTSNSLLIHIGIRDNGQLIGYPIEYSIKKITLTVASTSENASISHYLYLYSVEGDALFSEDADLVAEENDIMKWTSAGRASFLDLHRKAQRLILDYCDRQGYRDDKGMKLTKFSFLDNSDVRVWSYYMVLRLFFMGNQNQNNDVFKEKAQYYDKLEIAARDRASLNLDLNRDGKPDQAPTDLTRTATLSFR